MRKPSDAQVKIVLAFEKALNDESDRGCALLAVSFLDEELRRLPASAMVDDATVTARLLEPEGALGSLSSRIDFAYALGHIGKNLRRDLHLLRKIRNEFGHSPNPIDFSAAQVAARCRELLHTRYDTAAVPRALFINCVVAALGIIHSRVEVLSHATARPDIDIAVLKSQPNQEAVSNWVKRLEDEA